MAWRLLDFGGLDGWTIQSIYEAVAKEVGKGNSPNTLINCHPATPYVCIGVHQLLEKEVEEDFCKKNNVPIVRRQAGGGAVFLDPYQFFYHIIVKNDDPLVMGDPVTVSERLLKPTVSTYKAFGCDASFKPVNDVIIGHRKASGNALANMHGASFVIGNVIMDADVEMMAQVLKVPSEKFRDKIIENVREHMTSLKRELGKDFTYGEVQKKYLPAFESELGVKLEKGEMTEAEKKNLEEIFATTKTDEWLHRRTRGHEKLMDMSGKRTKVMAGLIIAEADLKSDKLIRTTLSIKDNYIDDIVISGDFFMMPSDSLPNLENALKGKKVDREELLTAVNGFFAAGPKVFGIKPGDIVEVIFKARDNSVGVVG